MSQSVPTGVIYRGQSFTRSFRWRDGNGAPVPIAGRTIRFSLRRADSSTPLIVMNSGEAATSTGSQVVITSDANGEFNFRVSDETTAEFDFNEAHWWVSVVNGGDVRRLGGQRMLIQNP